MEGDLAAPSAQSKPGARGSPAGARSVKGQAGPCLHLCCPAFHSHGTSRQYLSTHWAGFRGAAPPWKKTVRFCNENPPVLVVERRCRRRRVVGLQSAGKRQVQPPSISSLRRQRSPFLLMCDPRAQDPSLTPGRREGTATL